MIVIKGGRIVDPGRGIDASGDIWLKGNKIEKVLIGGGLVPQDSGDVRMIDASGKVVAPGLVDVHVHFRDPGFTYKEDIHTGAAAAAKGGFTTVVLMANTKPVVDNVETLSYVLEEGKKTGIHVLSAAAVSVGFKGGN